jgi:diguanylate cyclase (GGDEF)-like protein
MTAVSRREGTLVPGAALALSGLGVLVGSHALPAHAAVFAAPSPTIGWLAIAVAVVAAAQLAVLSVRVGSGTVGLAWGEAAIVILCALLPAAWIPAATLVGVGLAQLLKDFRGRRAPMHRLVFNTGALTLAATAAATAANLVTVTYRHSLDLRVAVALCLAAVVYALTAIGLVSRTVARRHAEPLWPVFRRTSSSKMPMVIGNVAVGLLVVVLHDVNPRWLALLPPALWLLHQAYAYRLRLDDERRNWQTFAEATRQLNSLDERGAAAAGIQGAIRLFDGVWAQLTVLTPDGRVRCYAGEADGEVTKCEPVATEEPANTARGLFVGGVRVGELAMRLRKPSGMRGRDKLMFAAYADALAAALHDAATHHELRAMTDRSSRDLAHDALTGLANRNGFLARGDDTLRGLAPDTPVALLLLDIDHFKDVNDTLGHAAGDELLQIAATRLVEALRPGELLARLGGDEFALLLTDLSPVAGYRPELRSAESPAHLADALARARALAAVLATRSEVARVQLSMEVSVGVVVAGAGSVDLTELLRRAGVAMSRANRAGSSVSWYEPTRDRVSTDRLSLLAELREALTADDQLALMMQPAVSLADGGATGVEALVRWHHPRRGLVMPAEFVTMVENSEMLGQFTRYVLDRALAVAAGWAAEGLEVPVAVNMSPRSLLDDTLPDEVAAQLARHGVPAERLVLEITETVVMSELVVIDDVLTRLRELGVQLAVDDFGTGYSSLTFLTRVPVNEVKIDRSFVRHMVDSEEVAAIVRTTIELAHRLDLRVVAEGVETAEQRVALADLHCTAAQGFHFYPPLPPERINQVLHELTDAKILKLRTERDENAS